MKKYIYNGIFVLTLIAAITQTASALPVPEVAPTSTLLGIGLFGLAFVSRFFRRR